MFDYLDVDVETHASEGASVAASDQVLTASGPARDVLRGERVAVNVAAHASGIATRTRAAVDAARIVDDGCASRARARPRPGLRGVEKRAVEAYAGTGVDAVSMGSLTHSAPALDYSFRTSR